MRLGHISYKRLSNMLLVPVLFVTIIDGLSDNLAQGCEMRTVSAILMGFQKCSFPSEGCLQQDQMSTSELLESH